MTDPENNTPPENNQDTSPVDHKITWSAQCGSDKASISGDERSSAVQSLLGDARKMLAASTEANKAKSLLTDTLRKTVLTLAPEIVQIVREKYGNDSAATVATLARLSGAIDHGASVQLTRVDESVVATVSSDEGMAAVREENIRTALDKALKKWVQIVGEAQPSKESNRPEN